jgi:hypothetical protein
VTSRRAFLAALVCLPAIAVASAPRRYGRRLSTRNPPEPGFEFIGDRLYLVFCDGEMIGSVSRVDTGNGIVWFREQGKLAVGPNGEPYLIEQKRVGKVRLVRVPK